MTVLTGVETPVSMDSFLQKRYRGKLERREVVFHDTLPPSCHNKCWTGFPAPEVQPQEGSSTAGGDRLLDVSSISTVVPPLYTEVVYINKDGIISNVRRSMSKRNVVLAMGESSSDVGTLNVGWKIQQRRGLTHLLNSLSSTLEGVVVIPDNDMH